MTEHNPDILESGEVESKSDMRRWTVLAHKAALGSLVGALIHEINNSMTFVALASGQIEKAILRVPGHDVSDDLLQAASLAHEIAESSKAIRAVVTDFRALESPASEATGGSIDLQRLINSMVSFTMVAHRTRATVKVDVGELPACPASFAGLLPAIYHVLRNAIEAMPNADRSQILSVSAQVDGASLVISVSDTGGGMTGPQHERALDAFFTTRSGHMGLGLTIAQQAVLDLGGELQIEKGRADGSCVRIVLPFDFS